MPSWAAVREREADEMRSIAVDVLLDALVEFDWKGHGVSIAVVDEHEDGPSQVLVDLADCLAEATDAR